MPVHANFDNVTYKSIEGYRIAACVMSNNGFDGAFKIYIEERLSAPNDFLVVDMGSPDPTKTKRGTLKIYDDVSERDYTFNDIDLVYSQTIISHYVKIRLLSFVYDPRVTQQGGYCSISNNAQSVKSDKYNNHVAQEYQYNVSGFTESALSFSARMSRDSNQVIRIGGLRSHDNSFLELAMQLDKEVTQNGIGNHSIHIKGQAINFDKNNLMAFLVDESYGTFLHYHLPSLDRIAKLNPLNEGDSYADFVSLDFDTFTPGMYLIHAQNKPTNPNKNPYSSSVDTGTIVMRGGDQIDFSKNIV